MQVTVVKQLICLFVVGFPFMDGFCTEIAVQSEEMLSMLQEGILPRVSGLSQP